MANEKRLIDANALYEKVERIYIEHYEKSSYKFIQDFFRAMFRRINNAPTVDAVEVVRCKDCVWCEKGKSYLPYCNHPTDGMHDVQLDDFCSYGERKDNE